MKVYEQEYIDEKIGRVIKAYVKQFVINIKFYSLKQ